MAVAMQPTSVGTKYSNTPREITTFSVAHDTQVLHQQSTMRLFVQLVSSFHVVLSRKIRLSLEIDISCIIFLQSHGLM